MSITTHLIGGAPLFQPIPDFRDYASAGAPRLTDCGGDLVLGTGCDQCSFCQAQETLIALSANPSTPKTKAKP